jgi:hypothetical protein
MPYYKIVKQGRPVGNVEVSVGGVVKFATVSYSWAVGKKVATLSEWVHRKNMSMIQLTDPAQTDSLRKMWHPGHEQGELL